MVKYRFEKWLCGLSAAILISASLSGCTSNPGDTQGDLKKYSGPVKVKTLEQTRTEERSAQSVVPVKRIHNTGYVALGDVARAIGFRSQWLRDGQFGVGDTDAAWKFRPGDSKVMDGDKSIRMSAPAVKQSNRLYVPVGSLHNLFGDAAAFRADDKKVSFFPRPEGTNSGADDLALPFKDGDSAPGGLKAESMGPIGQLPDGGAWGQAGPSGQGGSLFGQAGNGYGQAGNGFGSNGQGQNGQMWNDGSFQNGQAQSNQTGFGQSSDNQMTDGNYQAQSSSSTGDHSDVIREAEKYLGVRYDFGAGDYSRTHTFDCSSFTQYIFDKFGVSLPRTARAQGRLGRTVSRSDLQKGDLLFFSVPGRFKSDSTVGHVGIYMGNGQMINANTAPQDGVQITDINKQHWQDTFLFAKRILP